MNSAKYRRQWRKYQKSYERYAYRNFKKVFREWGKSILFDRMTENNYNALLALNVDEQPMLEAYSLVHYQVGMLHGKRVGKSINVQLKNFTLEQFEAIFDESITDYLRKYGLINVKSIKETYIKDIVALLETKLAGEITMPEIIKEIMKVVRSPRFYKWQAMRIARTESTAAANYAATISGYTSGYVMEKQWISSQDVRTRRTPPNKYDHYNMNGKRVPETGLFNVSGEMLAYPGDKGGGDREQTSGGNVINCRCAVALVPKRDENGRLVRKV